MSEELSGLDLRIAAYKSAGVKIKLLPTDPSTKTAVWPEKKRVGEHRFFEGVGSVFQPTEEKVWRNLPPCESSMAAAWRLLEREMERGGWNCELRFGQGEEATCMLYKVGCYVFGSDEWLGDFEMSLATAICRALVAAAEKERRFTDNEVSGDELSESGGSNLTEKNGVTNKP